MSTTSASRQLASLILPRRASPGILARSIAAAFLVLTLFILLTAGVRGATEIRVCPAGPPECDYPAIQPALDHAAPGDTVVVAPGVYSGALTLKSQVVLRSSGGARVTTIEAPAGPIIAGADLVSATLEGFTVDGRDAVAIGVELHGGELTIAGVRLVNLRGADATAETHLGQPAAAITATGHITLTLLDTEIQRVYGGSARDQWFIYDSGSAAAGIDVSGAGRVAVHGSTIRNIVGGAGSKEGGTYWCYTSGGAATGIHVEGSVAVEIRASRIETVVGGRPCYGQACPMHAGAATGVWVKDGSLYLAGSSISRIQGWPTEETAPSSAVHTINTDETHLLDNRIETVWATAYTGRVPVEPRTEGSSAPDSPCCSGTRAPAFAVYSEHDRLLRVIGNTIHDVRAERQYGGAKGLYARDTASVQFVSNELRAIYGLEFWASAAGVFLDGVASAEVSDNRITDVRGADGGDYCYGSIAAGGSAIGIGLLNVQDARVDNNAVQSLRAGGCVDDWNMPPHPRGGSAYALSFENSAAFVRNNTFFATAGGTVNAPTGQPGQGIGIGVAGLSDVVIANSAVISHEVGIAVTAATPPTLHHNNLWQNLTDYAGTAGPSDLHLPPRFVDEANGDLSLAADSPLIEAGSNLLAAPRDIENRRRPLDGNEDGTVRTDIGAWEYWPGLAPSSLLADRATAEAGDEIAYTLTIASGLVRLPLPAVVLTDTLPAHTHLVEGSLTSTGGTPVHEGGVIRWQGALGPGEAVAIRYRVRVEDALAGAHRLVNRALLDDGSGEVRTLTATVLAGPHRAYLPVAAR